MATVSRRRAATALLLMTLGACTKAQLGLPRVPLSVTAPDGRHVAFVRNHPEIDPPSQSIWVERVGESPVRIQKLLADMDWCDAIVWSADSSTVAFLIRYARLRVVHAPTGRTVFNDWIVEWHGEYPPAIRVRDLQLDETGTQASYRGCTRGDECSAMQTVDLR